MTQSRSRCREHAPSYRDRFARGLAISRAQSMNICASGLNVRLLSVTMPRPRCAAGRSTGNLRIDGYLLGMLTVLAATTARNVPVAARLTLRLRAWGETTGR